MKKSLTIIIFLFTSFLYGQNSIVGIVSDEKFMPLAGASIYLPDLNKGVVADENGQFQIMGIPKGKLKIQVSFMGYNTLLKIIEIKEGENAYKPILNFAVLETQEVVLIGGVTSSQHENAIKIDVLKAKEIQLKGSPNFMEVLTQMPGVEMISKGPGIAKPVIRGLSMNNVLSMNNGVRVENYQYSDHHPLGIDENDVERVEVIKGPASLMYGSDAIGGVVNFIKEKPAPQGQIKGDFRSQYHSNTNGFVNSVGLKASDDNFFIGARFGLKNHGDFHQGGGEFVPNSRFNEQTINLNLGYSGESGTYKLFYDNYKQKLGMVIPEVIGVITEAGMKNELWYQDLDYQMISSQNTIYFNAFKLQVNAAFQSALRRLNASVNTPVVEMRLNTFTYESKLNYSINKSEFIIGIQGMTQKNENLNNRVNQFLPNADINNIGLIALSSYSLIDNLKLQLGARYDFYKTSTYELGNLGDPYFKPSLDRNYKNFNASAGLTYSPIEKLNLRANFAKGYRVPNISELTSNGLHESRIEVGNPNLLPQDSYETDFSAHYHGEFLSYDIALFNNRILNYIYLAPTGNKDANSVEIYQFDQSDATLYGGEFGVHFHPSYIPWLHLKTSYSHVVGKQDSGDYLPFIPANKFRYEISAEKDKLLFMRNANVSISAITALAQNNAAPDEDTTPSYTLLNLSLNGDVLFFNKKLSLSISANNLLDREYFDHLSVLREENFRNQGRNFSFGVRMEF